MADDNVVEEAKNVMEMMSESEERLSTLQENLTQTMFQYQNMVGGLKELRESNANTSAKLKDNRIIKSLIKSFNDKFLALAQQVFAGMQDLCKDIDEQDAQLDKTVAILNKYDTFEEKSILECKEYEARIQELNQELEALEMEEQESIRKKQLEDEALLKEYEELEMEEKVFDAKIVTLEKYIECEADVEEVEQHIVTALGELQETVQLEQDEINKVTSALNEMAASEQEAEKDVRNQVLELQQKYEEAETVVRELQSSIDDTYQFAIDEVSGKIQLAEEKIASKTEENLRYENQLADLETNFQNMVDEIGKYIRESQVETLQKQELCKQQVAVRDKLNLEICEFTNKTQTVQEEIDAISNFIGQHQSSARDLDAELAREEARHKELKATKSKLKNDYNKRALEAQSEVKRRQEGIETIKETNSKLQDDTDALISELNRMKEEAARLTVENELQETRLATLDNSKNKVDLKLAQIRKKREKSLEPRPGRSEVSKKERKANWDSDSSIDEDAKRIAEKLKQRIKMRKYR
ncbi:hypothetical protein NQ315_001287 [Exocentrus adspersus]|uniref:Uncharacterized protein n=1 Tax=Exocentrus adspersus TaxID=1586481 RepID=A0AAV8WH95_9CUCU|nr:hypothetical protein NQ315_001287 [Exocentrus adspersus]